MCLPGKMWGVCTKKPNAHLICSSSFFWWWWHLFLCTQNKSLSILIWLVSIKSFDWILCYFRLKESGTCSAAYCLRCFLPCDAFWLDPGSLLGHAGCLLAWKNMFALAVLEALCPPSAPGSEASLCNHDVTILYRDRKPKTLFYWPHWHNSEADGC